MGIPGNSCRKSLETASPAVYGEGLFIELLLGQYKVGDEYKVEENTNYKAILNNCVIYAQKRKSQDDNVYQRMHRYFAGDI
ncbi:hypothetical protein CEXT_116411 [Caerostris extrusa]|uniref:Uncharacterized protein n=1 Tax=Caerostris extrusa TaxID=172846 RepID=A0AAV4VCM0_CAEEX|nr:hypothetical protein CEXT_116411 [Caerostris extrusa]